jgi:3-deoxy-D-manno-octulosonate 8-phosphate phosphatase (KDO 8-P phosphatase)
MKEYKDTEQLHLAASKVKLLLMDCDGVLTDGRLYFSERGEGLKVFDVKDGQGIVSWHREGLVSGIISGRNAKAIIERRAAELGMKYVVTASADKEAELERILAAEGLSAAEAAFIGDDLGDLSIMRAVGFPVAVKDAVPEVLESSAFVTKRKGGRGAVREVIDLILKSRVKP